MDIKDLTPEQLDMIAGGLVIPPDELASLSSDGLAEIIIDRFAPEGELASRPLADSELDSIIGGRSDLVEKFRAPGGLQAVEGFARLLGMADLSREEIEGFVVNTFFPNGTDDQTVLGIQDIITRLAH